MEISTEKLLRNDYTENGLKALILRTEKRLTGIDFIRGIAVILMVQQHLGFWLWEAGGSIQSNLIKHTAMVVLNGTGGIAAPLFIILAGFSAYLFLSKTDNNREIFFRGLIIILFGYLLNYITPSWFSMSSWYVLHLIGFGLIISPALKKLSAKKILLIIVVIVIITPPIHVYLETPLITGNRFMRDSSKSFGTIKLILAQGHFAILPWIGMFSLGFVCGKIKETALKKMVMLSAILILVSIVIVILNFVFNSPLLHPYLSRFLFTTIYLYPLSPALFFLLSGLSIFIIFLFVHFNDRMKLKQKNPVVNLGRISLTVLFLHVFIFREGSKYFLYWKTFSTSETIIITAIVLILFTISSVLWSKVDYRFSLEWIMRFFSRKASNIFDNK